MQPDNPYLSDRLLIQRKEVDRLLALKDKLVSFQLPLLDYDPSRQRYFVRFHSGNGTMLLNLAQDRIDLKPVEVRDGRYFLLPRFAREFVVHAEPLSKVLHGRLCISPSVIAESLLADELLLENAQSVPHPPQPVRQELASAFQRVVADFDFQQRKQRLLVIEQEYLENHQS